MAEAIQLGDPGPKLVKGSIIVVGADGGFYELGVGANGEVLTADSTETLGVKWA